MRRLVKEVGEEAGKQGCEEAGKRGCGEAGKCNVMLLEGSRRDCDMAGKVAEW